MAYSNENLIPNGGFQSGEIGSLPDGWELVCPCPEVAPAFELCRVNGRKMLSAHGNGNENCIGYLRAKVVLSGEQTYRMNVRFGMQEGIDPNQNLLFACYCENACKDPFNDGIFEFTRTSQGVEGENRFFIPGQGSFDGEIRIYFRFSANGKAWIESIGLEKCDPIPLRKVTAACTKGCVSLESWGKVLDFVGEKQTDIVLLPETFYCEFTQTPMQKSIENYEGPSCSLMSAKAREYGMYVAGTFYYRDEMDGAIYNNAVLYDRSGRLIGNYYKNHPFSPELDKGVSPGTDIPVFHTDFGCVGIMICYDSWFTDVAELLALKGAEIILFPNAGYYPSLMPARAADNGVRIVASSSDCRYGIWDTTGADVLAPDTDPYRFSNCEDTFDHIVRGTVDDIEILIATLDLSRSPSPHNWGGPMKSAPGGRRNRREQKRLLLDQIEAETERW